MFSGDNQRYEFVNPVFLLDGDRSNFVERLVALNLRRIPSVFSLVGNRKK
jgi:hypothetical protein